MKKMILAAAVLFSVAMVSCGGEKKAEESVATDSIEAETMVTEESVAVEESVVAPAESAAETPAEAPAEAAK